MAGFDEGTDDRPSQSNRKTSNASRKSLMASLLPVRCNGSEAMSTNVGSSGKWGPGELSKGYYLAP